MTSDVASESGHGCAPAISGGGNGHAWAAFIGFHVVSALAMVGLLATAPDPSGKVALVFPPRTSATDAFLRTASLGARPIRHGNVGWIVVAAPDADDGDFAVRARAAGVWAILNPVVIGACGDQALPSDPSSHRRSP